VTDSAHRSDHCIIHADCMRFSVVENGQTRGKCGGNVGEVGGTRWESDKRAVKIVPHETK